MSLWWLGGSKEIVETSCQKCSLCSFIPRNVTSDKFSSSSAISISIALNIRITNWVNIAVQILSSTKIFSKQIVLLQLDIIKKIGWLTISIAQFQFIWYNLTSNKHFHNWPSDDELFTIRQRIGTSTTHQQIKRSSNNQNFTYLYSVISIFSCIYASNIQLKYFTKSSVYYYNIEKIFTLYD